MNQFHGTESLKIEEEQQRIGPERMQIVEEPKEQGPEMQEIEGISIRCSIADYSRHYLSSFY